MKKVLAIAILAVMIMMVAITVVNAATSSTLANELYAIGSKYGMKESDKLKMERYLKEYPLSDEKCNQILDLAKQADQIMIDNNTTDYHSLPANVRAQLIDLANRAAAIAGVTLKFNADGIDVYKDGKLIEAITAENSNGKLAPTGSNINIALVVSSVAVIALAATTITVATKKRLAANA